MRRLLALLLLSAAPLALAGELTYVYSRGGDDAYMTVTRGNLDDIIRLQKNLRGTYIWAQDGSREFLIRDAAILAAVEQAMAPLRALEPEKKSLERRMRPLEKRQSRLENELDDLSDRDEDEGDPPLTSAERARMRELERELRAVERELEPLEDEEERLDDREEQLDEVFERELVSTIRRAIGNGKAERIR